MPQRMRGRPCSRRRCVKIDRITAQAFRGYPSSVEVVLSGDVVLLYGENGTGKTSLTEAFEWALFGTIVRKARSKTPGEYQGSSWLRNAHADPDKKTYAEVVLVSDSGRNHRIRRELEGNRTQLWIDGEEAADVTRLGLRIEDAFRPFLGQCEIQALIDSEQKDRWEQLSAILGFGDFADARQRVQRLRTDTDHDQRVVRTREIVRRAVQPLTATGLDPLDQSPDSLRRRASGFLGLDGDAQWAEIRSASSTQLDELYQRDRRPQGLERFIVGPEDLRGVAASLKEAASTLVEQAAQHQKWHVENRRSSFAEQGLELIDAEHPSTCPFCERETLTRSRLDDLRELAADRPTKPADGARDFEAARVGMLTPGPLQENVVPQILESLQGDESERLRLEGIADEQAELSALKNKLAGLAEGLLAATESASRPSGDLAPLNSLLTQVQDLADEVADLHAAVRVSADQLTNDLIQRFTGLNDEEQQKLAALQQAKGLAENANAVEAAWKLRSYQAALAKVVADLELAERREMERALGTLSADTARYFEEMSPGERIKISGIKVRDSRRRQAALEAISHGKTVNPVTMFSEAETNCLGLSLYFSQRVDRNPGWSMIMLDDPVQSMDQGHEEGLIGLLTRIRREGSQVVVMTHSRSFADEVALQFRKVESFTRYDFERGSGPDPRVTIAAGRIEDLLSFAEENAGSEEIQREACAAAIRKAVERFCRDLAVKHEKRLRGGSVAVTKLIDKIEEMRLVDELEVGTLTRVARFGSRSSHDDAGRNPTEASILANAREMRELSKKHLEEPQLSLIEGGKASA